MARRALPWLFLAACAAGAACELVAGIHDRSVAQPAVSSVSSATSATSSATSATTSATNSATSSSGTGGGGSGPVYGPSSWPDSASVFCGDGKKPLNPCPKPADAYYGQDGNYLIHVPTYHDNGNGTVTDNVSGFVWQQDTPPDQYDFFTAQSKCAGLSLAGGGWRVPSRDELISLVDYGTSVPVLASGFGPIPDPYTQFWSITPDAVDTTQAWKVDFKVGDVLEDDKMNAASVRCVRMGSTPPMVRYQTEGMAVHDLWTNLVWEAGDPNHSGTWSAALSYCNALNLEGHADWRLPSVKELLSIADPARQYPAIAKEFNYNVADGKLLTFWTSTPKNDFPANAWTVFFGFGSTSNAPVLNANNQNMARCVRGPDPQ